MPSCGAIVVTAVPLGVQGVDALVDGDPRGMPLLLLCLPPLLLDVGALTPPPIHLGASPLRDRLSSVGGGGLARQAAGCGGRSRRLREGF
jgi:hypothetical protein